MTPPPPIEPNGTIGGGSASDRYTGQSPYVDPAYASGAWAAALGQALTWFGWPYDRPIAAPPRTGPRESQKTSQDLVRRTDLIPGTHGWVLPETPTKEETMGLRINQNIEALNAYRNLSVIGITHEEVQAFVDGMIVARRPQPPKR